MDYNEYLNALKTVQKGVSEIDLMNSYAWGICRIQTQNAFDISVEANQKAKEISYQRGLAESCRTIGNCHLLFGDYKTSIIELETALTLFREISDKNGEAESLNL